MQSTPRSGSAKRYIAGTKRRLKDEVMLVDAPIFHSNRYHADASCEHCGGLIRHEDWCVTRNDRVFYAYEVAIRPCKLDYADQLILHALGVQWASSEPSQPQPCSV